MREQMTNTYKTRLMEREKKLLDDLKTDGMWNAAFSLFFRVIFGSVRPFINSGDEDCSNMCHINMYRY